MSNEPNNTQTLVLGGGCFWCTESVYKNVKGVTDVESGYSNGQETAPSYEMVCTGRTGCNEVVKLEYDPAQISTREILEIFFVVHDATTLNRQGNDTGTQYRSGIYFTTPEQQQTAQALIDELTKDNAFGSAHRHRAAAAGPLLSSRGIPPGLLRAQPEPGLLHGRGRAQGGEVSQDVCAVGEVDAERGVFLRRVRRKAVGYS